MERLHNNVATLLGSLENTVDFLFGDRRQTEVCGFADSFEPRRFRCEPLCRQYSTPLLDLMGR